ncbi:SNF2 helicase associated domain-containing protein [Oceanobacillus iheyensis]|uniref:DEAD/DEAH box helicase n=1 Tax=Oceanobacillus iheyensis TaxID=182710 RepID=UPI00363A35DE
MKSIKDIDIQKLFPSAFYKRGLTYYKNDQVKDVVFDRNHNVWTATVQGSEDYFVEIGLTDMEKGSIDTFCDCPAFETFGSCKHIVASLIAISTLENNGDASIRQPNFYRSSRFIEAMSNILTPLDAVEEKNYSNSEMSVEYIGSWTYDRRLQLEIKTGEQHRYVVRNVASFLDAVQDQEPFSFTKKFTYEPSIHSFLEADMEILRILHDLCKNEELYDSYTFGGRSTDRRYVTIPPYVVKDLLFKLVDRNFYIVDNVTQYKDIQLQENELPFQFYITKQDEHVVLSMSELKETIFFPLYNILFQQGVFYFPTYEQIPVLQQMEKFRFEDMNFDVPKEQTDTFLSEVIPSLQRIGDIDMDDHLSEELIKAPLQAKCYLELRDGLIIGKLEYQYGSHRIDPFQGKKDHQVMIIRDVPQEKLIMKYIEDANFRYNGKELYMDAEEEDLYHFLYHVLPYLDNYVELFLSSEFRGLFIENEPEPYTSVRMEGQSNLLEIGFNIDGINDNEVNKILQAVIERKRFFRLQSGQMMNLETEEFSSMQRLFDDMRISKEELLDGKVQMPAYRGSQLDDLIETKKHYDPHFRDLLSHLHSPEEQVYEIPQNVQANLRSYQKVGYQWFKSLSQYHLGGILADDMGLGKTLQSITYLVSESNGETIGPHLIVVPSSVVYNWKNELEKFAPHLQVAVLTGNPIERHQVMSESTNKDIWITSYATLRQDIEFYQEITFQTLLLDEAQYIKNYQTKTSRAIRQIKATRRFALSGTPIENSIEELWSIFQVVLPGLMPDQRSFKQLEPKKIAAITRPFILRRLKQDVLKELPEKIESVHVSELTREQKDLYVGYLRQVQQEAVQSFKENGFQQNRMKILAGLTRLRQICCHPSMFIENYEGASGKLEQLMETIKTALDNGKRMLIFSQFTSMHEIIQERLKKEGYGYFYLHGQTSSKERVEMSERFNHGENDIFLISLKAGGTGLNLTGADTVILFDLWWNPAVEDQATGRAHRFGQKKVVQVIRLVTEGTIEEKIYDLQQRKRELIDQVIQPGETMLSSLNEDDIKELLSL